MPESRLVSAEPNPKTATVRLYFVDWLRVLSMIAVFFFHNARFFDMFDDWHVKNATTSMAPTVLIAFLGQWIMPIFFVLAAAGTYYALKFRSAIQYVQERTKRLLIPLVFGMLVIVVPQAYFEVVSHTHVTSISYLQFYPQFLGRLSQLPWYHLWFLAYLFAFSLITLPVFRGSRIDEDIDSRLAIVFARPWIFLPFLVFLLAFVNIILNPQSFWGNTGSGGWNIIAYFLFFVSGYLIFSSPRIMETVKKLSWVALAAGIVTLVTIVLFFIEPLADEEKCFGTTTFAVARIVQGLNSWLWILAILGIGSRFLNRNSKFLDYSNEAVLPFYILHQTVIISVGFYVVQWNIGIPAKYAIISSTSFIIIMAIYELLIRRVNALRFLFGMKIKKKELPRNNAPAPERNNGVTRSLRT